MTILKRMAVRQGSKRPGDVELGGGPTSAWSLRGSVDTMLAAEPIAGRIDFSEVDSWSDADPGWAPDWSGEVVVLPPGFYLGMLWVGLAADQQELAGPAAASVAIDAESGGYEGYHTPFLKSALLTQYVLWANATYPITAASEFTPWARIYNFSGEEIHIGEAELHIIKFS